jgi:glycerol kinase
MKITYGTGVFMLANIGPEPKIHPSFITTILFKNKEHIEYAYECSIECGGGSLNWARRIELFKHYDELNQFESVLDEELYFFPSFG